MRPLPRADADSLTRLFPSQRAACLILNHSRLEEVAFLLQVDHLAHPRERVFLVREQRVEADLLASTITDETQIALEHGCIQTEHAARHRVFSIPVLQLNGLLENLADLRAEFRRPQLRFFKLDLVDQVDTE